jgi:proteasome beta subunit
MKPPEAPWNYQSFLGLETRGDFFELLRKVSPHSLYAAHPSAGPQTAIPTQTHATTILAFKYKDGVIVAGDRRATAGNFIVHEHADKVLEIDEHSVLALSGVPAMAFEMAHVLEHSFRYFRRSQLQELSIEAKVRALGQLIKNNLPLIVQGIGVVVPIFVTYELRGPNPGGKVFFYDALGAQFEVAEYATTGSGSLAVRSLLYYENRWGGKALHSRDEKDALLLAVRGLDCAAEADAATGGINVRKQVYPMVKLIRKDGITRVPDSTLKEIKL